ncbi:hypothetical protein HDU76_008693 [Blyttiomyces sp. JEL0837]|nr:hypothetical protein HDU76_008693 [Blyttiomyces sp. JEL0837]
MSLTLGLSKTMEPSADQSPWVGHDDWEITRLLFTHFKSALTRSRFEMLTKLAIENDNSKMLKVMLGNNVNLNWFAVKVLSLAGYAKSLLCLTVLLKHPRVSGKGWTKKAFLRAVGSNNLMGVKGLFSYSTVWNDMSERERVSHFTAACSLADSSIAMLLLDARVGESLPYNIVPLEFALAAGHHELAIRLKNIIRKESITASTTVAMAFLDLEHFLSAFERLVVKELYAGRSLVPAARVNQVVTNNTLIDSHRARISWNERFAAAKEAFKNAHLEALKALLNHWDDRPNGNISHTNSMGLFTEMKRLLFTNIMPTICRDKLRRLLLVIR